MRFNHNIVQNIIEANFMEDVAERVSTDVWNMSGIHMDGLFERDVDLVDLDDLLGFRIDKFQVADWDNATHVAGIITVFVSVDGISRYDGEDITVGSADIPLRYRFFFTVQGGKYDEFELMSAPLSDR